MTIDDQVDDFILEKSPQSEAVKSLINVKGREKGALETDIELKTDLSDDDTKIHTAVDLLSNVLEMDEETFSSRIVIAQLVNKKERKLLSKNRQSRQEIVNVARQPDTFVTQDQQQNMGWMKRFFSGKKREQQR